jgi:hypothetical protein
MKEFGQNSRMEDKEQAAARPQEMDLPGKELKETRQPAAFKLYGVGRQREQHRTDPFSLYGVEHNQPEPFDLYGVDEPQPGPFDLYGVEEDHSK